MLRRTSFILGLLTALLLATGGARLVHEWSAHGLFDQGHLHECHGPGHDHGDDQDSPAPHDHSSCPECAVLASTGPATLGAASGIAPLDLRQDGVLRPPVEKAAARSVWRANGRGPPSA